MRGLLFQMIDEIFDDFGILVYHKYLFVLQEWQKPLMQALVHAAILLEVRRYVDKADENHSPIVKYNALHLQQSDLLPNQEDIL